MSRRAKLSLSDEERRKRPPPAHGFEGHGVEASPRPSRGGESTADAQGKHSVSGSPPSDTAASQRARPAAGPWKADLGPRHASADPSGNAGRAESVTADDAEDLAAKPWWQHGAVRVTLVSAAAVLSIWFLRRRFL